MGLEGEGECGERKEIGGGDKDKRGRGGEGRRG